MILTEIEIGIEIRNKL